MPKSGYHTESAYAEDISFGRLFLGLGPKTIKQPNKPKPAVPVTKPIPQQALFTVGGKMYSVVDIKPATLSPPAAEPPPPASPSPPASVAAPPSESPVVPPAADAEATTEATTEAPAWTNVQDALLLGLKALNKTWKEIGVLVEGKDTEDLRDRYAELTAVKSKEKKVEEENTPGTTEETEEQKEGDKKKDKKNKKKHQRGDKEEADDQEENGKEGAGHTKKDKKPKNKQPKGILKPDEVNQEHSDEDRPGQLDEDGEQQIYRGHPVIYLNPEDGLSPRDLTHLSNFYHRLEREKWLLLSSRLFDKTGKRISPGLLKEKFKNLNLI